MIKYSLYESIDEEYDCLNFYLKSKDLDNPVCLKEYSSQYGIFKDYREKDYISCRAYFLKLECYSFCTYERVVFLYKELLIDYTSTAKIYGHSFRREVLLKDLQLIIVEWDD